MPEVLARISCGELLCKEIFHCHQPDVIAYCHSAADTADFCTVCWCCCRNVTVQQTAHSYAKYASETLKLLQDERFNGITQPSHTYYYVPTGGAGTQVDFWSFQDSFNHGSWQFDHACGHDHQADCQNAYNSYVADAHTTFNKAIKPDEVGTAVNAWYNL